MHGSQHIQASTLCFSNDRYPIQEAMHYTNMYPGICIKKAVMGSK